MRGSLTAAVYFRSTVLLLVAVLVLGLSVPSEAFHFPWDQGHDTFDPEDPNDDQDPGDDACPPGTCCRNTRAGSPVELMTGNFTYTSRLVRLKGRGPEIDLTLTYNSRDARLGQLGRGWIHNYDQRLVETTDGTRIAAICTTSNGKREVFERDASGRYVPPEYLFADVVKLSAGSFQITELDGSTRLFDPAGHLRSITDHNGNSLSLSYDDTGFLTAISDAVGRSIQFVKGADGRTSDITDPIGRSHHLEYDSDGNLTAIVNPLGERTAFAYDDANDLARITDARGVARTLVTYDSKRRVAVHVEDAETWTYSYNAASRRTTKTDSHGRVWGFDFNERGVITQRSFPDGSSETFRYDASLNVVEHRDQLGGVTSATYDDRGHPIRVTDPLGNSRVFEYDPATHRIVREVDPLGSETRYAYDARGNLTRVTRPAGAITQLAYDSAGSLMSVINPANATVRFTYDVYGNVVAVEQFGGKVSHATRNSLGRVLQTIDEDGRVTDYEYDAADRLVRVRNPQIGGVQQEYDAAGNRTALILSDGSRVSYEYDQFSRVVAEVRPGTGARRFEYDSRGLVIAIADPAGNRVTYAYDNLGRLSESRAPDDVSSFQYDPAGRLIRASDSDSSVEYSYDAVSNITTEVTHYPLTGPARTVSYEYDASGNRTRLTDPTGQSLTYTYDEASRLASLDTHNNAILGFAYDALSRRTALLRPQGATTTYKYDAFDRLVELTESNPSGDRVRAFEYDGQGNVIKASAPAGALTFSYDALGALTGAQDSAAEIERYAYNALGDRIDSHAGGHYEYDAAHRLVDTDNKHFTYDANGNRLETRDKQTDKTVTHEFDSANKLTRTRLPSNEVIDYRYDALGRRVEMLSSANGSTKYVYDGERVLVEETASGARRWINGPNPDEVLGVVEQNRFIGIESDRSRSTLRALDESSVIAEFDYDSFGQLIISRGSTRGLARFQGHQYDDASGLVYMRARYYDPSVGQFVSQDPIGYISGQSLYGFVRNNPLRFTDPQGLYPGEDIVEFFPDAFGADKDFWDNYWDMRDANTIGADKYFHCRANCEAARRGPGGALESWLLSEFRELTDEHIKGDPPAACNADRQANDHGRDQGRKNRNVDCGKACSKFRPSGLNPKY